MFGAPVNGSACFVWGPVAMETGREGLIDQLKGGGLVSIPKSLPVSLGSPVGGDDGWF